MQCPNCGETSRIRKSDKFCHRCGKSLKDEKNAVSNTITIARVGSQSWLKIGNELVELDEYSIKTSSNDSIELSIIIKGNADMVEMSLNLESSGKEET